MKASEWQSSVGDYDAILQACIDDLAACERERDEWERRRGLQKVEADLMFDRAEKAEARLAKMREALEKIAQRGCVFDAKGTWSVEVNRIARAAIAQEEKT